MGLNAYFTFTVVQKMGVPWQVALGCVFLSGLAFLLLTFAGIRQMIVTAIPKSLYAAVAGGIGIFIAFIGLREAGIVISDPNTGVGLGDLKAPATALALFGLLLTAGLLAWQVRGAILIGIVTTTLFAWATGVTAFKGQPYDLKAIGATAFQLDIGGAFHLATKSISAFLEVIFVFLFVDLFDNVGTLVGVSKKAGLIADDGTIPGINRILISDSLATIVGSFAGTSTVTSYVESAAGVSAGGRTGLSAVVTGLLFLAATFVAPYAQAIPAAATAPALILVGSLMMASLTEIDWDDPTIGIPAFLTLVAIPLTFSIANGLAFGITAYAVLRIVRGQARRKDWMLLTLAGLFVVRFAFLATE
jgi:AGZA family xanthine/uracil permease-like MFS transporter